MNIESRNTPSPPPQACAPCNHQRKKCDDSCELAPYFPANRMSEFQNADRVFGVSNIQRLMASVEPRQRQEAADSILMEANLRTKFPVHGSLGIILNLKSEIDFCMKRIEIVNRYLEFFRQRERDQGLLPNDLDLDHHLEGFQSEISEPFSPALDEDQSRSRYNYMSNMDEEGEADNFGVHDLEEKVILEFDRHDNLDGLMHMKGDEKQIEKSSVAEKGNDN